MPRAAREKSETGLYHIMIYDNESGRSLMRNYLEDAYNNIQYGVKQSNGRVMVNTLVGGPNGFLKLVTVWQNNRLITINTYKSVWTHIMQ